jgi:hypothetical protein
VLLRVLITGSRCVAVMEYLMTIIAFSIERLVFKTLTFLLYMRAFAAATEKR